MLHTELIHKLDMIAFEGWEYHKLPSENLADYWSTELRGNSEPLAATLPVTNKHRGVNPVQPNKGHHPLNPVE